jgi:hypothetical protein
MVRIGAMTALVGISLACTGAGCATHDTPGSSSGEAGTGGAATGAGGSTGAAGAVSAAAGAGGDSAEAAGSGTTATAGASGSGASGSGAAGTASAGGTSSEAGTSGNVTADGLPTCASQASAASDTLLTDFSSDKGEFVSASGMFGGGTYVYPASMLQADGGSSPGLAPDYPDAWHITGTVSDYSGFGLYIGPCAKADLSAAQGIKFDISGSVKGLTGGAASSPVLTFAIASATDSARTAYTTDPTMPSWGLCKPTASQYDGSCLSPSLPNGITLKATPTTVTVKWTDLANGKPAATLDPTQVMGIAWALPWSGAQAAAYSVDITVDNIALF